MSEKDVEYEAPDVEDLQVDEGPATVQAGGPITPPA
jgi:hypothetical protein